MQQDSPVDLACTQALSYRTVPSIADVDAAAWDSVCADAHAGLAMDRRFVAAIEHSFAPTSRFWHVVIDQGSVPVACASFSTYPMDLAPLVGGTVERVGKSLRRLAPTLLRCNVLFCGLPVFFGLANVSFRRNADRAAATQLLARLARRLAAAERAELVVFKEFDDEGCRSLQSLTELGYVPIETPPMYHFRPKALSFEGYCASLRAGYRRQVKAGLRRFEAAGFRYVRVSDPQAIRDAYTDDVHKLYVQVAETAALNVGCMPPSFVPELATQLPGQVSLGLAFKGDEAVGLGCSVWQGDRCHILLCGFDRQTSRDGDVYFNIMYQDLAHGMTLTDVQDIEVGQTAERFKARLGCEPVPLKVFVRPVSPVPALVLRVGFARFIKGGVHPMPQAHHVYRQ